MKQTHFFSKISISVKIILILLVLILPLNIFSIYATKNAENVILDQAKLSSASILNNSIAYMDSRMTESNAFLFNLLTTESKGIIYMEQNGDDAYQNAKYYLSNKMISHIYGQTTANVLFLYSEKLDDLLLCKDSGATTPRQLLSETLSDPSFLSQYLQWKTVTIGDELFLLHTSYSDGIYYGSLLRMRPIINEIQHSVLFTEKQVYADMDAAVSPASTQISATSQSAVGNIYIHILLSKEEILKTLPITQRMNFTVSLIYLALIPLLILILNHSILRPLRKISYAIDQLGSGNKEYRIGQHHHYSKEFLSINHSFNSMADRIVNLEYENFEKEIARQKMELQNLQLQIRPHFLLNTFNLMYSLSRMDDREDLEKTIVYMTTYFRYIFRNKRELSSLAPELELIYHYMEITEIRYPSCFSIQYNIPDSLLDIEVPPLLIHTFIENAVRNNARLGEHVLIELSASYHDNIVCFTIKDNGNGIEPHIVEQINSGQFFSDSQEVHIGIQNSYQRLKYFYGEQATIHVTSTVSEGSCFTISFPCQQDILKDSASGNCITNNEGEGQHEFIDCK